MIRKRFLATASVPLTVTPAAPFRAMIVVD